jgi:hypothetical protein
VEYWWSIIIFILDVQRTCGEIWGADATQWGRMMVTEGQLWIQTGHLTSTVSCYQSRGGGRVKWHENFKTQKWILWICLEKYVVLLWVYKVFYECTKIATGVIQRYFAKMSSNYMHRSDNKWFKQVYIQLVMSESARFTRAVSRFELAL